MSRRSLAVVTAGLSQPSSSRLLADQLAQATRRELGRQGEDVAVTTVELREHAHDLTNRLLTGFATPTLRRAVDDVVGADALVVVTPIFNASYSGLFKTFFDVLDDGALADKPVLIGGTGGTARHSLALEFAVRPLFAYLRGAVVPTAVFAATEDFGGALAQGSLADRVDRASLELARAVTAREPSSSSRSSVDLAEPTPFEQLLAGT